MRRIYMDANATTPLLPEVLDAMRPYFIDSFGNASSIHQHGQHARAAVEHAREQVAALLNCRPAEIVFTSCATESDNMAIFGVLKPGDHLITSSIEHHAILHAAEKAEERGVEVTFLPVSPDGVVDPYDVYRALKPRTKLISIMMANNETGVIQPVEHIGKIAAEAEVYFHTDAVQAAGKIPVDVKAMGCHLLSISGHKMHAPQGTGILYIRRGTRLEPLLFGGSHERQRRAGTENVAGIVGLGKAAEIALEGLGNGSMERVATLRDRLEAGVLARVAESGVNGGAQPRVPNTTNLYFDRLEGEALVIALDLKGLATSGGSACASGATEPSHVLSAMGLPAARARASLRFSLMKQTTEADIDYALEVIPGVVNHLRELSPVNAGTLG
ncbi:cysteine desulfurase family protein [Paracidobacterium acidisoli]|uniref:cysteine desulfurase n=1 Tax=Paracidobacterium acidisoli TaxID=2303751 RepID=A0A372IUI6_9BACT|nr:cysteine desulfurase family protein [Paracidobacterium acidisoli]MBT9330079.1 cysteine desulfurase [Paracidobacterium acidisoli]